MVTRISILALFVLVFLAACGPAKEPEVQVVEDYLTALVEKNGDELSVLSCADWELNALLELDSLQAVDTRLEDLSCSITGTEDGTALVACQGKLIATYNGEDQDLDLSVRTYQVVEQGGNWLVCGYR
ncbi:hypothetical protein EG834_06745 [bacterium]|nr:hypothetical protein [bacterium]